MAGFPAQDAAGPTFGIRAGPLGKDGHAIAGAAAAGDIQAEAVVLDAGPGGYRAAFRAAGLGKKCCIGRALAETGQADPCRVTGQHAIEAAGRLNPMRSLPDVWHRIGA